MSKSVRISGDVTLRELDLFDADSRVDAVVLPRSLSSDGDFSVEASIIQLVGTLIRKNQEIMVLPPEQRDLSYFGSSYAIPLHVLGKGPMSGDVSEKYRESRKEWIREVLKYIEAMYWGRLDETLASSGATKTNDVCFVSIPGLAREALLPIYKDRGLVRSPSEFAEEIGKSLRLIIPSTHKNSISDGFLEALGLLVHELYENVEQHGSATEIGQQLSRNAKVVLLKYRFVQTPHLKRRLQEENRSTYGFYLGKLYATKIPGSGMPTLEISVVDLGPGFFKRWISSEEKTGVPIDIERYSYDREISVVSKCFDLHKTSKGRDGYGVGLARVRRIVAAHSGFIRIRTGRVALGFDYGDFRNEEPLREFYAGDAGAGMVGVVPYRDGALISILLPLIRGG